MGFAEAYRADRAFECADFSDIIMMPRAQYVNAAKDRGYPYSSWFEHTKTGTQAALCWNSNRAILAFRGTQIQTARKLSEALKDIKTDLMFRKRRWHGVYMHRGFLSRYLTISDSIKEAINICPDVPLFITGHSLGGGLAKIAAIEVPSDRIAACYVFGAPRVGTSRLDSLIGAPLYQIVYAADLVPRVPLLTMNYRYAGDKRYIDRKNQIHRAPSTFRTGGQFVWTMLTCPPRLISDHNLVKKYMPPLHAAAVRRGNPTGPTNE